MGPTDSRGVELAPVGGNVILNPASDGSAQVERRVWGEKRQRIEDKTMVSLVALAAVGGGARQAIRVRIHHQVVIHVAAGNALLCTKAVVNANREVVEVVPGDVVFQEEVVLPVH